MVYASGRPLWHLSLCHQTPTGRTSVLRWSPTLWRRMEAIRDSIFRALGTTEPVIAPEGAELAALTVTMQWRKPLSIVEINQMAETPEVRARPGRP